LCAAAGVAALIEAAAGPANASIVHNVLTFNSLTHNALSAGGLALDDLNGVAVEAVTPPRGAPGPADGAQSSDDRVSSDLREVAIADLIPRG
jgi:hypothetical protein